MSVTGFNKRRRQKERERQSQAWPSEGQKAQPEQAQEEENQQDLSKKTFAELRQLAKGKEITGYGKMNKKELIEALER